MLCVIIISACTVNEDLSEVEEASDDSMQLTSPDFEVRHITSEKLIEIEAGSTYEQVIRTLGSTKDIGSGLYVAAYQVDDVYDLLISYADLEDICKKSGEEMLEELSNQ